MKICEDFKLDYEGLFKAFDQPHATPPAASSGGASAPSTSSPSPQPSGQGSSPRPGHKYVKRWWDGGRWQYEYPGEGGGSSSRGAAHFGDHQKREHTLELKEGHGFGEQEPERAYKETLAGQFSPGQSHEIEHPGAPGQRIRLQVDKKGQIHLFDPAGQRLKAEPFKSHGAYERWYRGVSMQPKEFADPGGKPWLRVVPNLGKPDASGVLQPSADPTRAWILEMADDADPEMVKRIEQKIKLRGAGELGRFPSPEKAMQRVSALKQALEAEGVSWGGGDTSQQQPAAASTLAQTAAGPPSPQQPAQAPVGPKPGMDSPDPLVREMAQHGWGKVAAPDSYYVNERLEGRNQFLGPPEVKEKIVQKIAQQYSPKIMALVSDLTRTDPRFMTNPKYWQEQLLGGAQLGETTFVTPEPGSLMHSAIGRMVDKYDPSKGIPLAAYVSQSLSGDILQAASEADETIGRQSSIDQTRTGDESEQKLIDRLGAPGVSTQSLQAGGEEEEVPYTGETARSVDEWKELQGKKMRQLFADKKIPEEFFTHIVQNVIPRIRNPEHVARFFEGMNKYQLGDHLIDLEKSLKLIVKAILAIRSDLRKAQAQQNANPFITKDKKVDPTHQYSHMEGDKDHPRYYYKDQAGNFLRYTNAPTGNSDASGRFGEPKLHPAEPTAVSAPQFFDLKGRKLSRAPYPGTQVQWNPNYHPHDPENLWVGRWVNPLTGEHEHTYVDADLRMIPKLHLHQQVALVDVRLPVLRKYVRELSGSPHLKDKITAMALAFVDQGRFSAEELTMLRPADVTELGPVYKIGNRFIYADSKVRGMLSMMTKNRTLNEPLFAVPFVKKDGEVDPTLIRRVGPHFLQCSFDQLGISLSSLRVYHASETFSREVQRLLMEYRVPWQSALEYATIAVAQEMGHDITQEPDIAQALPMLRDLLVDPVVIEVLQRNAEELGLSGQMPITLPLPPPSVAFVSLDLTTRTSDEDEFSKWLHGYPAHLHADMKQQMQVMEPSPVQPNPPNAPSATEGGV